MGIRQWALATLLALGVISAPARAATIDVGQTGEIDLAGHVGLLEDVDGRMDIDQARRAKAYVPAAEGHTSFGFTESAWWARVVLRNDSDATREMILRQDYPLIDAIDLWTVRDDAVIDHVSTGDRSTFDTRSLGHRDFLFPLVLPPNSETTIFVRMRTDGALNIGLSLYQPARLLERLSAEQFAFGLYFGGFFVLIVYNFFIFLAVRDRPFLFYLLYATSYGLYFGIHDGFSFQYLWPNHPAWANTSLLVMLALTLTFGMQFTRSFLGSQRLVPRLDKFAMVLEALAVAAFVGAFFLPYRLLIVPVAYLTLAITVVILWLGVIGLLRRIVAARFFMIAWATLLLGVLVYMAKTFGLLPHNVVTQNGFQIGSLLEMVLLSLALAHRVRELNQESRTDPLTQLMNRRAFDEVMEREYDRAAKKHAPISMLMIDIDHFKRVNDRYGHPVGDQVLRQVADVLAGSLDRRDIVGRYGGEEFAVLMPGLDAQAAMARAQTLCEEVRLRILDPVPVTISIGVASTGEQAIGEPNELFARADAALYRAKCTGRDRAIEYLEGFASPPRTGTAGTDTEASIPRVS